MRVSQINKRSSLPLSQPVIEESIKQENPMTNKKINEGVLSEEEDTGVMAKYTLYMLSKSATRLHKMIQDEEVVSQEVLDILQSALSSVNTIKTDYDNAAVITPSVEVPTELYASATRSIVTRHRTEMSDNGSVGYIYKDGVEQGMYEVDTLTDTLYYNDQEFHSFDDVASAMGGVFSWDDSDMLDNVTKHAQASGASRDRQYAFESMFESARKRVKIKSKNK